jgi:hypothetical protein
MRGIRGNRRTLWQSTEFLTSPTPSPPREQLCNRSCKINNNLVEPASDDAGRQPSLRPSPSSSDDKRYGWRAGGHALPPVGDYSQGKACPPAPPAIGQERRIPQARVSTTPFSIPLPHANSFIISTAVINTHTFFCPYISPVRTYVRSGLHHVNLSDCTIENLQLFVNVCTLLRRTSPFLRSQVADFLRLTGTNCHFRHPWPSAKVG